MKKKLLGSFIPAAAGLMLLTPVQAAEFSDLGTSQRFYDEMMYLEQENVISGYPDGTFRPANEVTRAEATIMIGRSLGLEEAPASSEFSDVSDSVRASGYINELTERGIISGYPDGTFRPGKEVSRGEMAILLTRAFNFDEEAPYSFIDLNRNMASYDYVSRFLEANITYGYPDGTYRPAEGVSRADFSAFLARSLNDDFQQEPRELTSYAKEQSYTFTIEYFNTGEIDKVTYQGIDESGRYYLWENTNQFGESNTTLEYENINGLHYGILNSEGLQVLAYPVEVGTSWEVGVGITTPREITDTGVTIETEAGVFTDAIEVTEPSTDYIYYVVEDYGVVYSEREGEPVSELINVE